MEITDKMVMVNHDLPLMGSGVLVMLMKGEDLYLMNRIDGWGFWRKIRGSVVWRKRVCGIEFWRR